MSATLRSTLALVEVDLDTPQEAAVEDCDTTGGGGGGEDDGQHGCDDEVPAVAAA
eukprot:CAMPEP_0203997948 /NCGR_PEP_ID=MMETSP0360-20130528/13728_1 /ASSEMBLY_ACC=CAM_ASM_000342 /TAXON_ID=268821 /ORGANISM="Scrippsiella Hangoei, Strain SHTV-5" /LENGTH=54 /DNA_ID=CAMNT_0050938949 /DNA_START=36 /DNA_END=200 /DNA_ORIENTATION=+